jgi:hypothetical protein
VTWWPALIASELDIGEMGDFFDLGRISNVENRLWLARPPARPTYWAR